MTGGRSSRVAMALAREVLRSPEAQLCRACTDLIGVDGALPGPPSSDVYRLDPGRRRLTVAEAIDPEQFNSVQRTQRDRQGRERYKDLILDVQPGITYRLGARHILDKRNSIRDNAYWEPVIWAEAAEPAVIGRCAESVRRRSATVIARGARPLIGTQTRFSRKAAPRPSLCHAVTHSQAARAPTYAGRRQRVTYALTVSKRHHQQDRRAAQFPRGDMPAWSIVAPRDGRRLRCITVHPRPDLRHIRPYDVLALAEVVRGRVDTTSQETLAPARAVIRALIARVYATRPQQATWCRNSMARSPRITGSIWPGTVCGSHPSCNNSRPGASGQPFMAPASRSCCGRCHWRRSCRDLHRPFGRRRGGRCGRRACSLCVERQLPPRLPVLRHAGTTLASTSRRLPACRAERSRVFDRACFDRRSLYAGLESHGSRLLDVIELHQHERERVLRGGPCCAGLWRRPRTRLTLMRSSWLVLRRRAVPGRHVRQQRAAQTRTRPKAALLQRRESLRLHRLDKPILIMPSFFRRRQHFARTS